MRKKLALFCLVAAVSLSATTAMAGDIKGKLGVTGRIGFIVPADSDIAPIKAKLESDAGFVGGGGFIYGIDRNIAAELDITHSGFSSELHDGSFKGDFDVINIGLGAQYRFVISQANLTPYAGAGAVSGPARRAVALHLDRFPVPVLNRLTDGREDTD